MAQRILITGITGFVGSHLAEWALQQEDVEVHGIVRWRSKTENIDHFRHRLQLHECDLRDPVAVTAVIHAVKPVKLFHLAAQSFVQASWGAPSETLTTNILGEVNILEAIRRYAPQAAVHIAGSSEEYGLVLPAELPIKETNPLRPPVIEGSNLEAKRDYTDVRDTVRAYWLLAEHKAAGAGEVYNICSGRLHAM